jgi:hypothetical protein
MVNSLYPPLSPIMFFAEAFGGIDETLGEAIVGADDPMIVPMPAGLAPMNRPKLMGASLIRFDQASNTVAFLENTTQSPWPDVAMARRAAGNYVIDPLAEPAIRATVEIDPMVYVGPAGGVHRFADTPIRLMKNAMPLLQGMLQNVELDTTCGVFDADLSITMTAGGPGAISEIAALAGQKKVQFASTAGGYDLLALTQMFAVSGQMPWPEIFHLGITDDVTEVPIGGAEGEDLALRVVSPIGPDSPVRIRYVVPEQGDAVRLDVYDASGRLVRVMLDGPQSAGEHEMEWDRRDATGGEVGPGVFFVRLVAGGSDRAGKFVVLRQ